MGEILKIENGEVVVGKEDGNIIRIPLTQLDFAPKPGDKVKIFSDDGTYYIQQSSNQIKNTQTNESGKYPVNKIAYVVLAFLLGGIGAHKFYAHKYLLGILYLVFVWTYIPALIALIEAIIALTKKADENGNIFV
ncbi:TM2 domain-containing protein [Aerococcus loyolae]|uniref:TM2 domain-containing protein n=1 Tax=Aerococcus urinae TaxID=1376 RepID=A0A2I1L6R7_9LACT|nr:MULTISPECIES: TM2 domain-containing protein [Aerococcus]MCY3067841.1 TM2 domain-containing protein [Aerococcus mictus]MCY3080654.1 TM2 domain-containing protein [Aerococcus mictus]MDK6727932.1 TM2 domain-containing protein [Aerococcus urinae]MDK7910213.1 TM2 domain-containing protein [Aerococcus urinae]MDK8610051.1 TM2 domain-containing protein [Aerococcus urinae]